MPGRLSLYTDLAFKRELTTKFGTFRDDVGVLHKQYNIAPTLDIPIYTNTRVYTYAHFGLIPSWEQGSGERNRNKIKPGVKGSGDANATISY